MNHAEFTHIRLQPPKTKFLIDRSTKFRCLILVLLPQDYTHLQTEYFDMLAIASRHRAISSYLRRLLSRSITFSNHEERLELANQINKENESIRVRTQLPL